MSKLTIPTKRWWWPIADTLMVPIMFVLRGFKTDSLQETHAWHVFPIDPTQVDPKLLVPAQGNDPTVIKGHYSFLFHAPIFGGWKNYSVYEVDSAQTPFYIGWITRYAETGELYESKVHALPIGDNRIRTLDGPPTFQVSFFAVNQRGEQIPLKSVGHGRLGDGKFLSVRLF